ncbi:MULTISPECIES: hypothetical protein [Pseudomonas]|uniref:Uncharacterized protein n=1 Tax=Pseudomonas oryzihabitans TaxID=47885 RepID=A0A178LL02_9PSED|nr:MULTISPECIES: hypothetical protein [Pseudomonas]NRH44612.1 hypothetical protein [Pseudomonas sp. MS15a(2019)]OAN31779.1 hypothetical protein A4V15_12025 [Pseudomonas oryzihabitans]
MLHPQNTTRDALSLPHGHQRQGELSPTLARLAAAYGKAMTPEQIAKELEYSATYVAKKIGAAGYEHLPWVKAIAPHRRKRGLRWVYATEAVAKYLDTPQ